MKAITIFNPLKEDFIHQWSGQDVKLPAKSSQLMEDWLAKHMAKHLADHMLNLQNKPTDHPSRAELLAEILPAEGNQVEAPNDIAFKAAMLNPAASVTNESVQEEAKEPFCDSCDSKGVRHKKDCPKAKKPQETEFEGTNQ
jgi:hypothetical protein